MAPRSTSDRTRLDTFQRGGPYQRHCLQIPAAPGRENPSPPLQPAKPTPEIRGKSRFSMPSSGILPLICVVRLLRHNPALFLTYAFSRGHPYMRLSDSRIFFHEQNLSGREGHFSLPTSERPRQMSVSYFRGVRQPGP